MGCPGRQEVLNQTVQRQKWEVAPNIVSVLCWQATPPQALCPRDIILYKASPDSAPAYRVSHDWAPQNIVIEQLSHPIWIQSFSLGLEMEASSRDGESGSANTWLRLFTPSLRLEHHPAFLHYLLRSSQLSVDDWVQPLKESIFKFHMYVYVCSYIWTFTCRCMYVCMLYAYSCVCAHGMWMQVCVCIFMWVPSVYVHCAHRCMYGGRAKVGVMHLPLSLSTLSFETRSLLDLEFTDSTKQDRQGAPGIHLVPAHRELQGSTQSPPTGSSRDPPSPRPQEAPEIHPVLLTGSSRDPPVPAYRELQGSTQSPPTLLLWLCPSF